LATNTFVRLGRLLRVLAQALVTTGVATGLLFLLRAQIPRAPVPIHDAVPLDELPAHDSVSLLLLASVWTLAAAAVLLLSRAQQTAPPLVFAVATFCCSLASCALSLEIVRQTTTAEALIAAAVAPAVYIEALVAALAAMLTARIDTPRTPLPVYASRATTTKPAG
jgi:hypothetical protein